MNDKIIKRVSINLEKNKIYHIPSRKEIRLLSVSRLLNIIKTVLKKIYEKDPQVLYINSNYYIFMNMDICFYDLFKTYNIAIKNNDLITFVEIADNGFWKISILILFKLLNRLISSDIISEEVISLLIFNTNVDKFFKSNHYH